MEKLHFSGDWDGAEPVVFACAYAPAPGGGPQSLLACVYGWGGARGSPSDRASWEGALEAWGWRGGALDGDGLDDFVALGPAATALLEAGAPTPQARAEAMACLGRRFFQELHGAPIGGGPCAWWIDEGAAQAPLEVQAAQAKLEMMARWQALRLSREIGPGEGEGGPVRI